MNELTARQQQILEWITQHFETHGVPPTRAELALGMGFKSANAAEDHLRALDRKGAIELIAGSSRGIRLKEMGGIPLVGRVAAGSPILAVEHIESRYRVDPQMFTPRADYLLRVRGLSMRDAGILDNDLLAVHATTQVRNGQIVVARLGDEVTVKRYQQEGYHAKLLPENPDFQPITLDLRRDSVVIEGLGVGVIRNGSML